MQRVRRCWPTTVGVVHMEIVYMTPKETGVDAIENQRPLKLQEALKKVTVGIRKDRMASAWERLGVCDASQYAFLRGRSTI